MAKTTTKPKSAAGGYSYADPWKKSLNRVKNNLTGAGVSLSEGVTGFWNWVKGNFDGSGTGKRGLSKKAGAGILHGINNAAAKTLDVGAGLLAAPLRGAGKMLGKHQVLSILGGMWLLKKFFDWRKEKREAAEEARQLRELDAYERQQVMQASEVSRAHLAMHDHNHAGGGLWTKREDSRREKIGQQQYEIG